MLTQEQKIETVKELSDNLIPFHKVIGLTVSHLSVDSVETQIAMKGELIGNPYHQILHGGVIATVLDATGGMLVLMNALDKLGDTGVHEIMKELKDLGTIDLRVDYLRPGRGQQFTATSKIIRAGARVSVARMELHNELGEHIALGTGTYLVG